MPPDPNPPGAGAPPPGAGAPPPGGGTGEPVPYYREIFAADGAINRAALDRLPEPIRYLKDSPLANVKNADDVFYQLANAQTLAGRKGLLPLPPTASDADKAARGELLDAINGVPKEFTGYGITRPADIPEQQWQPALAENFAKWCKANHVSPSGAQDLIKLQLDTVRASIASQGTSEQRFFQAESERFGQMIAQQNIPADKASMLIERGATMLGIDLKVPRNAILFKNADVQMMALKHALANGEAGFAAGESPAGSRNPQEEVNSIMYDETNPLHAAFADPQHPQFQTAKERLDELFRLIAKQEGAAKR